MERIRIHRTTLQGMDAVTSQKLWFESSDEEDNHKQVPAEPLPEG